MLTNRREIPIAETIQVAEGTLSGYDGANVFLSY